MNIKKGILVAGLMLAGTMAHTKENEGAGMIIQNGINYPLRYESMKISLEKSAFAIRCMTKVYTESATHAVQIAAFTDATMLDKIQAGSKIDEVPYFSPGTGMAADKDGYSSIFLNEEGHHYIYYASEEDKRATVVSRKKDEVLLEWQPRSFYLSDQDVPFSESGISEFFMVILFDSNNNGIADQGEFHKVTIRFDK